MESVEISMKKVADLADKIEELIVGEERYIVYSAFANLIGNQVAQLNEASYRKVMNQFLEQIESTVKEVHRKNAQ